MKRIIMTTSYLNGPLAIAAALLVSGCVHTKIESNKSPDFHQPVSKIYVTVKGSSQKYMKRLSDNMQAALDSAGIQAVTYYYDPLSLDTEKDVEEKIKAYHPDLVMLIGQTERRAYSGSRSTTNRLETGLTLDIRLFIPDKEKPVWRANLRADSDFGINHASENSAKKIIHQLKEDGMIR